METQWKATQINPLATQIPRYVIPNTKALKNWLKFENVHFFYWNFAFLRYALRQNTKNAKHLALEEGREAAEKLTQKIYF